MRAEPAGFLQKRRLHILILVFLGFLAYSNTFIAPFQFDDQIIIDNTRIRDLKSVPSIFIDISGPIASRPLMNATFAVNYWLDGLKTSGYHIVNLALHILNSILLYLLVVMTGRHLGREERETIPAAMLSAALFVLHPVQTEAVTYIISRSMLLATAFYLSGLMLFLKAVTSENRRGLQMTGLLIVSLLGMASREDFVTFPLMLLLYDLFFISRFNVKGLSRHLKFYLPAILSLGYLAFLVLSFDYPVTAGFDVKKAAPLEYLMTQFNVIFTYIRLLILPINQNLDYDYSLARTLFEFPTILSFLGYTALWAWSIYAARRHPIFSFSMLWFLITLLPASSIMPLADYAFEHRLYLPMAGPVVLLAVTAVRLSESRRVVIPAVTIIALTLGVAAHTRNKVWLDQESLWEDVIEKSPNKVRGYNNLGRLFNSTGQADKAREKLLKALELQPGNVVVRYNLGISYIELNMPQKALEHLNILIAIDPSSAKVHSHMGRAYAKMGRHKEALMHFREALGLDPNTYNYNKVAETYLALGDAGRSIEHFEESLRLDPGQLKAHTYLGLLYKSKGETKKEIEHLLTAVWLDPENPALHQALADAYKDVGNYAMAQEHLMKAESLIRASGAKTNR